MKKKNAIMLLSLAFLMLPAISFGQDAAKPLPDAPAAPADPRPSRVTSSNGQPQQAPPGKFGLGNKFRYYMTETYLNPGAFTSPAFAAGIRMANPPGKGATAYPPEWRQGAEAFGRNYGDAFAQRVAGQTARFVTGAITREDPRYTPSGKRNVFSRSLYALGFTFVDRSDSGHPMPALSNFVGAAAGGFVGNAYLPDGFTDVTHAGQRATVRLGTFAAGNLFREFAPQMPGPMRLFFMLIAR